MSKLKAPTGVSQGVRNFLHCLSELAILSDRVKKAGERKTYSQSVEILMALGKVHKDWTIQRYRLVSHEEYSAEIWTDRKTHQQLIVAFRDEGKTSWPVDFVLLEANAELTGIFSEISPDLLRECSEAALRTLETPIVSNYSLPFDEPKAA